MKPVAQEKIRVVRRLYLVMLALSCAPTGRAGVACERIFMPEGAAPSSFAIGLPGSVNFCFDAVRGGVSYVWSGGFIDPSPARNGIGKFVDAVKLLGPIVYRETGPAPLRQADPARVPIIKFLGYTLRDDSIEFRYAVDGTTVREEVRVRTDGKALTRHFLLGGSPDATWWYVIDGKAPTPLPRHAGGACVLEIPLGKAIP